MKNNKGITLLMMLIMISALVGVIMTCAFVLGHEVNKDERYEITRQRMLEVKRALIGRLADVGGGKGITSCGGFINDYGEPNNVATFDINSLLNNSGFTVWDYDNAYKFWGGYRGERYLNPSPGETDFRDGWGYSIQVNFDSDETKIKSLGKDGIPDGAVPPADYDKDVEETFCWQRNVQVDIVNSSVNDIKVRLIYPNKGTIEFTPNPEENIGAGSSKTVAFSNIPVGLRKIEILEGATVKRITMLYLPPGGGIYAMEQIDYSG